MTISSTVTRYELLVRFREDGTLSGAHQIMRRIVTDTDTGEILADTLQPAAGVDPAAVADVLDEHQVAIANQVLTLAAERDAAIAERDAAIAERDAAIAERDTLAARVAELEAQLPPA